MSDQDEIDELKARLSALESKKARARVPWGKIALGGMFVLLFLIFIAAVSGPKTYSDIANEDAADCVRTGNDGQWYPGQGNLQQVCEIRGGVKALQKQAIDAAQK